MVRQQRPDRKLPIRHPSDRFVDDAQLRHEQVPGKLGAEPLHIGLGGVRPIEINELVRLVYDSGKAEKYYICVDLGFFGNPEEEGRYPRYLLKKDILSRLRYLLSYEVRFRYIPIDLGLVLCGRLGVKLPDKVSHLKEIDRLGDWEYNYRYRGEAEVAAGHKKRSAGFRTSRPPAFTKS